MDIDDIRRNNIRTLEKTVESATAAAEKVQMSYSQYLNYRNGAKEAKTGKLRGMRKETAQRFEAAFGMRPGWLDENHAGRGTESTEPLALPYIHPNPIVRQVIALMEGTDEAGRGMALMAVSQALERYRPIKESVG